MIAYRQKVVDAPIYRNTSAITMFLYTETILSDDEISTTSREASPYAESPQSARVGSESPNENTNGNNSNNSTSSIATNTTNNASSTTTPTPAINNSVVVAPNGATTARYASVATCTTITSNNHSTSSSVVCMKSIAGIKAKSSRKVNIKCFFV